MAEKTNSNKSGAGKFFLGAAIGAALGAIAGRFISAKTNHGEEDGDDCECGGECKHCNDRDEKIAELEVGTKAEKSAEKKVAGKKVAKAEKKSEKPAEKTEKSDSK